MKKCDGKIFLKGRGGQILKEYRWLILGFDHNVYDNIWELREEESYEDAIKNIKRERRSDGIKKRLEIIWAVKLDAEVIEQ
mgnify:CR=1 FL=1